VCSSDLFGDAPKMPERLRGAARPVDPVIGRPFDIENEEFGNSASIPRTEADRDQTGLWKSYPSQLGERVADHPIKLLDQLIMDGETELGYDGVPIFSEDHEIGKSGKQSNLFTSVDVGKLDVADPESPTPEEAVGAVLDVATRMLRYRDSAGEPMNATRRAFTVISPTNTLFGANVTATTANNLAGGQTNILPAMKVNGYSFDTIHRPRFPSDSKTFYVAITDHAIRKPFVLQEEIKPEVNFLGPGTEYYIENNKAKVTAYWRGAVAPAHTLMIAKATFS